MNADELDRLYDSVEKLMAERRLRDLGVILDGIPIAETHTDILLGYLTATLPVKNAVPERRRFYASVRNELMVRRETEIKAGLLDGLE